MNRKLWENLSSEKEPSWYLDPVTAKQKRETHLNLIRRWTEGFRVVRILKTDLFEEAFGEDSLLDCLFPGARLVCGTDAAFVTAKSAFRRHRGKINAFLSDVRHLAIQDQQVDLVISTSTLDHFDGRTDFLLSLEELVRVLKPGGLLIITMDNPWNPLYHILRWFSSGGMGPFFLGYTESAARMEKDLAALGLRPENRDWLLHNPRGVSTLIFLILRKLLPRAAADKVIQLLLDVCELLGRFPTRKLTACFVAVSARKPV